MPEQQDHPHLYPPEHQHLFGVGITRCLLCNEPREQIVRHTAASAPLPTPTEAVKGQ